MKSSWLARIQRQWRGQYHTAPCAGACPLAGLARGRPDVEITVEGVTVDSLQLLGAELQVEKGTQALLDLFPAAGSDQRAGDGGPAQHPGDRHLRQALTALVCNLIERAHAGEIALVEHRFAERAVLRG